MHFVDWLPTTRHEECHNEHQTSSAAAAVARAYSYAMSMSHRFFTSSSLSPVQSPRKVSRMAIDGSDGDGDEETDHHEYMEDQTISVNEQNANESYLGENEFEVEAILARKGGYNGKTLMYKIRWVGGRSCLS